MQVTKCDKCERMIKQERIYRINVLLILPKGDKQRPITNELEYCEKCFKEDCPALIRGMLPPL